MQAQLIQSGEAPEIVEFTVVAACSAGDVIQLPDGRAGVCVLDYAAGDLGAAYVSGDFILTKHTAGALLVGGDVYWDVSAEHAQHAPDTATPDFYFGVVIIESKAAAATTVKAALNKRTRYDIDLGQDGLAWAPEELTGTGGSFTQRPGGVVQLVLDSTNEAQQVAIIAPVGVPVTANPIVELKVASFAMSDNTVDIDFGVSSATHATDFESVAEFAAFHLDGGDLDLDTHSDDGTTDRAPLDSTLNVVDDTYNEFWIDLTDHTNIKFYMDGVLIDTSGSLRTMAAALTASLKPVVHIEKTAGTATGDVRVARCRMRCGGNE